MKRSRLHYTILYLIFLISNLNYGNFEGPKQRIKKSLFSNVAPTITANGNQIYCVGSSLKIVTDVTITDPDDSSTDAVYLQISSGYNNGQDKLSFADAYNITSVWDAVAGKLKLYNATGAQVLYTDFEKAIKAVEYRNSSPSPSGVRSFSITIGQANYLARNGHYYQYISNSGISWTAAKAAAETSTYFGLRGYLATITATDEAQLCGAQASGNGWIGGTDAETEGVWKWVTGPEGLANGGTGTIFWNGGVTGSAPPNQFAFWNTTPAEPNNSGDEDYAHITAPGVGIPGSWNDLRLNGDTAGNYQAKGYIVEYGGMPGDPILNISASTTITIPRIENTTPASSCGSGSITLQATASNGAINWYATPTSSTSLQTGNSFDTPFINTTTTYYVDAGCVSTRVAVVATINTAPNITATSPSSVCNSGTVTLGAVASAGVVRWYNSAGNLLTTGNSFTTPSLSTTTTYYVDAIANGCASSTRTDVIATVYSSPTITSTTPGSRCDSGTVTLEATASSGNLNWYSVATEGTSLGTGTTFTTPSINSTTTFYVEANSNGCKSPRTSVIATVYPLYTTTEEVILCQGTATTLDAAVSDMKYLWSPNGETIQTIVVSSIGNYSVTISSPTVVACDSRKNITVIEHPLPIINSVVVNENSITIELAKSEIYYEYSINGVDFQVSNQFSYIPTGQYTAFVRENNGCNLISKEFTIVTLSNFFTPNNDSHNDYWGIKGLTKSPLATLTIFDRYGKYITTLSSSNPTWDGTLNGTILPASDYWYVFKLDNDTPEVRGHFTLKR